jgi:two-component system, chemotaxis family, chemotaxis protein CheY
MAQILVVDDSKFSRGRVVSALTAGGHQCIEAENGQLALEAIAANRPDLVVSDLLMPVLDGFGLLKALHEQGSSVPVIVSSADIQASSREQCESYGAKGFLNKPFQPDALRDLASQILAASQVEVTV